MAECRVRLLGGELRSALPKPEFLDLAGGRFGQRSEHDTPRTLEVRQPLATPLDDCLLGCESRVGLQAYKRAWRLSPARVWHCDDRCLHDLRVPVQQLLHLEARYILPARDDDVLRPIFDLYIAVRVQDGQVPSMEPSSGKSLSRGCRIAKVPFHERVAANHDLPKRFAIREDRLQCSRIEHCHPLGQRVTHALTRQLARARLSNACIPMGLPLTDRRG